MNYLITRHPGAVEWAREHDVTFDAVYPHLQSLDAIAPGDGVYGILPVNLAAEVCARGARYFHLCLELPAELRGIELDAATLRRCHARFECFRIYHSELAELLED